MHYLYDCRYFKHSLKQVELVNQFTCHELIKALSVITLRITLGEILD